MKTRFGCNTTYTLVCGSIGTSHENIGFLSEQTPDYSNNLFRFFARGKNDFGKALAERSVMINSCIAQILKWHMLQVF